VQVANVEPMEVAGAAMQKPVISGGWVRVANVEPMEVAGATSCKCTTKGGSLEFIEAEDATFSFVYVLVNHFNYQVSGGGTGAECVRDLDSDLPPTPSSLVQSILAPRFTPKYIEIPVCLCDLYQPLRSELKVRNSSTEFE